MKVGFDAHVLDGRFQGSRTVIQRLVSALSKQHPDIEIVLFCDREPVGLGGSSHVRMKEQGALKRLASTLPRFVKSEKLDVLIYQYICAPWSESSWVFIHDLLPITHAKYFNWKFVVRSSLLFFLSMVFAKRVVVVSEYTLNVAGGIFPWMKSKLVLIRNGPSFERGVYFEVGGVVGHPSVSGPYVLVVGRLERRKNIQMLVDAFRAAAPPSVTLVVVGAEDDYVADFLDSKGVVHISNASDDELVALYRGASLFVYPSLAEGFGLPLLDAVLFGVPALASNQTAMPEVGGGLAEYFDPLDSRATEKLSSRIREHFSTDPIKVPSIEDRRSHADAFSWRGSANILAEEMHKSS